ncbi:MAG: GNAT family N-acetyltransferase [bacterium]|nr:GNAT family N-acetyltransferase [bacterium]
MTTFDLNTTHVVNNREDSRFEAVIDGQTAFLSYQQVGNTLILTHANTPLALRGQGIAGVVTKAALDYAQANGMRVTPLCSYVVAYLRRHPEYQPLVK